MTDTKVCRRCLVEKPADQFGKCTDHADGLQTYCRNCKSVITAERYARVGRRPKTRKPAVVHRCRLCGKDCPPREWFCSSECRTAMARRKTNERAKQEDKKRRAPRRFTCKQCGTITETEYGDKRRSFCSGSCAAKWSERSARGGDLNHRARMYLRDRYGAVPPIMYQYINWLKVIKRDGWVCGICGLPINAKATFPEDDSPSVDHIVPLARGGPHLYSNVQAAHFKCNWAKGDSQ